MTQDDKTPVPIDDSTIPGPGNSQGAESRIVHVDGVSAHGTAHDPRRWMLMPCPVCDDDGYCNCGLEQCGHHCVRQPTEVMPVSEHEAVREAAQALADAVAATSAWYLQPVRRRCEELCAVLGKRS
jgi:hypothetical protein